MNAKKKSHIDADLNFVSAYALEQIVHDVQRVPSKNIHARTIPIDDDNYLFQMAYERNGRVTALVNGRLRRWAGDMTHVYCDGRVFRRRFRKVSFYYYWGLLAAIGTPIVLGVLFILFPFLMETPLIFIWAISLPIMLVTVIIFGFVGLVTHLMRLATLSQPDTDSAAPSKSEDKDRERLLDALANIIADPSVPQRLQIAEQGEPLSREEVEQLIKDAQHRRDGVVVDK